MSGSRAHHLVPPFSKTPFGGRRSVAGLMAAVAAIAVLLWLVATAIAQARAGEWAGNSWHFTSSLKPVPFWPGYLHRLLGLRFMWPHDPAWDWGRYILPVGRTLLVLLSPWLILRLGRRRRGR